MLLSVLSEDTKFYILLQKTSVLKINYLSSC